MIRGIHGALTHTPVSIYGAQPRALHRQVLYGAPPRTPGGICEALPRAPLRTFFEKKVLRTPKNF